MYDTVNKLGFSPFESAQKRRALPLIEASIGVFWRSVDVQEAIRTVSKDALVWFATDDEGILVIAPQKVSDSYVIGCNLMYAKSYQATKEITETLRNLADTTGLPVIVGLPVSAPETAHNLLTKRLDATAIEIEYMIQPN